MTIASLGAKFVGAGGDGVFKADGSPAAKRNGVGVAMDCPCGCEHKLYVGFTNPIDGGPPLESKAPRWDRTGDTIETLTLRPSIQRREPCPKRWHGWITNGKASEEL